MASGSKTLPLSASGASGGGPGEDLLLRGKYVRSTRFTLISSGTSGALSLPPNSSIVLDDFGGTTDAVLSTVSGGRPDFATPKTSSLSPVATTLDSSGNYVLSGTPSAYPIALIYRVKQALSDLDDSSDILGGIDFTGPGSSGGGTSANLNLDGGFPSSTYGGITPIDGGGV